MDWISGSLQGWDVLASWLLGHSGEATELSRNVTRYDQPAKGRKKVTTEERRNNYATKHIQTEAGGNIVLATVLPVLAVSSLWQLFKPRFPTASDADQWGI
jgi:hypothetical protein